MIPGELGGEKVMIRMEAVEDVPWIIGKEWMEELAWYSM